MKKLLLILLVVALASFLLVGCLGNGIIDDGDGDGDGDVAGEVTVDISDSVVVDGKTYVSGGAHTITVTFPAPVVGGVGAYITDCGGDYSKAEINGALDCGSAVVLFPNTDRTVWTGSGEFGPCGGGCCASYVEVWSGECIDEVCIWFPVIVDSDPPYAQIEICVDACDCDGCELSFTSTITTDLCDPDVLDCGDDCSGLDSWSIDIYDDYPFDECCNVPCETPIASDSGECPVDFTTACLGTSPSETLYAVVTLADNVGNVTKMGTTIVFNPDTCDAVTLTQWPDDDCVDTPDFVVCEAASGYTLTMAVDPIGGGTATDQTGSSSYAENTLINIFANPASGYEFLYWTTPGGAYDANFDDQDDPATTFTMPGADTTVTARFLEFVQNNKTFSEDCDTWTADQSAGGVGITIDIWDISSISPGNAIDFKFDAMNVPDRWFIYYNGA
jgi:hypothetical protein